VIGDPSCVDSTLLKIKQGMSTTTIEQSLLELNQLVLSGKALEAFEKFYHDDVSMQENDAPPTVSKEANRKREIEFFGNISEFRSAEVKGLSVGDNISFVIWKYDYTHKEWGVKNYTQVSVQYWSEGKIIRERFLY
jgi:hypothetical protein